MASFFRIKLQEIREEKKFTYEQGKAYETNDKFETH